MNDETTITKEEFDNADAVVTITYSGELGGFQIHAEGNNLLSRPMLARVLAQYAHAVLEDEAARN